VHFPDSHAIQVPDANKVQPIRDLLKCKGKKKKKASGVVVIFLLLCEIVEARFFCSRSSIQVLVAWI
jgi:hypothetical protein